MNGSNVKWTAVLTGGVVTEKVIRKLSLAATQENEMMQYTKFFEKLRTLTGLRNNLNKDEDARLERQARALIVFEGGDVPMPSTDKAFFFVKTQDLQQKRCYIGNVPQHHDTIRERVSQSVQV